MHIHIPGESQKLQGHHGVHRWACLRVSLLLHPTVWGKAREEDAGEKAYEHPDIESNLSPALTLQRPLGVPEEGLTSRSTQLLGVPLSGNPGRGWSHLKTGSPGLPVPLPLDPDILSDFPAQTKDMRPVLTL